MAISVCVFDAYGTLFDVAAAARQASTEPGAERLAETWSALAETWRLKQLQYTWLRATYGTHTDFWEVTTQSLDYALELHGLADDDALRGRLLQLYWELAAFPEVPAMLRALKEQGRLTAILSNGAPDMLAGAVRSAGIEASLDAVLSAEQVGVFKPSRAVYALVEQVFGCARRDVLFVSSNGWDAACAAGFGFETVWVNRKDEPVERLPWRPTRQMSDLSGLPDLAEGL